MNFFGKYRGTVENNIDPMMLGRVQVSVPAVLGDGRLSWAMPCSPYAGDGVGLFAVPPVGANVWVEFEAGDPDKAICAGGFWSPGQVPGTGLPTTKILKTDSVTITVEDLPGAGGVTIETAPPATAMPVTIKASSSGVEITVGASTIALDGVRVSVNGGALEVI